MPFRRMYEKRIDSIAYEVQVYSLAFSMRARLEAIMDTEESTRGLRAVSRSSMLSLSSSSNSPRLEVSIVDIFSVLCRNISGFVVGIIFRVTKKCNETILWCKESRKF